jgi:hypothetical protein
LPLDAWFRGPELGGTLGRISDPSHPGASNFDRHLLARLVREHQSGAANHGEVLWLLANVFLWSESQAGANHATRARSLSPRTFVA